MKKYIKYIICLGCIVIVYICYMQYKKETYVSYLGKEISEDGKTIKLSNITLPGGTGDKAWHTSSIGNKIGRDHEFYQVLTCKEISKNSTYSVTYDSQSVYDLALYKISYFVSDGNLYVFCGAKDSKNVPKNDVRIETLTIHI